MSEEGSNYITGLQQEVQQYEAGLLPPIPEPPQTFVVECNKTLAQQDGDALRTNAWTNSFPPIKLKKGDIVSVNSAFLSTRGSGDLLQFDDTNNKMRLMFEYYATNDNANNKKPSYNIKGFMAGAQSKSYDYDPKVGFMNSYPVNYRPMPLYRLVETFKESADFSSNPDISAIEFTDPTQAVPFYSAVKESNWGYKQGSDFIFDGVEDKYVAGLFRNPVINVRENLNCAIDSTTQLDPTTEPFFGKNLTDLRVWYVSTPMSKYGPCSDNASMRIYFAFSNQLPAGNDELYRSNNATFSFLRGLRVGEYIQFKDADFVFGTNARACVDSAGLELGGSSIFYCSGYASCAEGVEVAGTIVDAFTQMGTPNLMSQASGIDKKYYDMTLKNPLGQILKVVRINFCNDSSANKNGVAPRYAANRNGYTNEYFEGLPWIEVQAEMAMSIALNNPNVEHPHGVPSMGPGTFQGDGTAGVFSPTLDGLSRCATERLQMAYRTWYCGANLPLATVPKITNTTAGVNTIYRSHAGVRYQRPYPENPHGSEGLNEKLYIAFRPYYYSVQPAGNDLTDVQKNLTTAYSVDLREDRILSSGSQTDFYNNVGITEGSAQYLVAHNYNFTCKNKDGTLALTKGSDITETQTYGGARLPRVFNDVLGFNPDNYDTPIATATRIGFHNQGQSFFFNSLANNVSQTGGFYDNTQQSATSKVENRTSKQQKGLSPNGNLYIENQAGIPTRFFFGFSIDGSPNGYSGIAPDSWDKTEAGKNNDRVRGVSNYIVASLNCPQARYAQVKNADGSLVEQTPSGLWYGYDKGNAEEINQCARSVNGYDGLRDMRFLASQMPTLTYARFTNDAGESEVMYIKIQPYSITFNPTLNTSPIVPATRTVIQPNLEGSGTGITKSCAVAFYILQRNCDAKGVKTFKGTDYGKAFSSQNYDPYYVQEVPANKPQTANNFFEILNDFAMAEHQIEFDNLQRDLIPTTASDFNANPQYIENFGDLTQAIGTPCGGDFYLCKYPNMPFDETATGIRRVVDNQIRLTTENIKGGNPTRVDGISNYTKTAHTGKYEWLKHYDYVDLDISGDKVYFSPTDIASLLTDQLHKSQDTYKSWDMTYGGGGRYEGGYWPNTAGSYPTNSLFRIIHPPSSSYVDETSKVNNWDAQTGYLNNDYHEGDFCFFADMAQEVFHNGINAYAFEDGKLGGIQDNDPHKDADKSYYVPNGGKHVVWPQNNDTYINTLPSTDVYTTQGFQYGEQTPPNTIRNFHSDGDFTKQQAYRNRFYQYNQTFGSTFIGSNNAQLNFNTEISRFEWKFFHQPKYSDFTVDSSTGATTGGQIVSRIWSENIVGYDNWDRYGGINAVNWACPRVARGTYVSSRSNSTQRPLEDQDPVGLAFLNKLGFSSTWVAEHQGSTDYADTATFSYKKSYKPLGTTASDYDVSQAKPYTQVSLMYSQGKKTGDIRSQGVNSALVGFGATENMSKTIGGMPAPDNAADTGNYAYGGAVPFGNIAAQNETGSTHNEPAIKSVGATLGYGLVSTVGTPQSVNYQPNTIAVDGTTAITPRAPINLNLDDVKFFSYDITCDSNAMVADELPKKTIIGYFLIMSDIIDKHEFLGSANDGSPLNCIGILSKNYENNDFYFSFQSPVEFHIKQDRTITSIKTTILTPTLTDPAGLDYNSSIIYTILRPQSIPEPDVPPIAIQQALDYAVMEQMSGILGIDQGQINPYSQVGQMGLKLGQGSGGGAGLNSLRQNLVSAVLHPSQNSASMIFATQSAISQNISRMPLHQRAQALNEGLSEDPNDEALKHIITPAETSIISQPTSSVVESGEYLSEQQQQIQHANLMKAKAVPPSESGFGGSEAGSVFSFMDKPHKPSRQDSGGSGITAFTDYLEEDEPRTPTTPLENRASQLRSQSTRQGKTYPSLPLAEFFSKFMASSKPGLQEWYRKQAEAGMDVDNPNTWSLDLLKQWKDGGKGGDFFWDNAKHTRIGGVLNVEAKYKLNQAIATKEKLSSLKERQKQTSEARKAQASLPAREAGGTKEAVGERPSGMEDLITRISRSWGPDTRTKPDEKQLKQWDKQNPYDLRTWAPSELEAYKGEDGHHGVPKEKRNDHNKLNKDGYAKIIVEQKRRVKAGGGRVNALRVNDDKSYKKKGSSPDGYIKEAPHTTPHSSLGATPPEPARSASAPK